MNLNTFLVLVDRLGFPAAALLALIWLCHLFIRGPAMRLVEVVAAPFSELARTGTAFLQKATAHLEALPAHISLEAGGVRELVARESAAVQQLVVREASATREHVSGQVGALRDRVGHPAPPLGDA